MAEIKGGKKLGEALKRIADKLGQGATLKVGFFQSATYPDGKQVALIAYFQDYGTRSIPPRPFFRNMVAAKSGSWPKAISLNLKATNYDVSITLERVGMGIRDQLKQSIRDTNAPPLAPSTIARKGFDKPLIDTARMLNSAGYEVNLS